MLGCEPVLGRDDSDSVLDDPCNGIEMPVGRSPST
jgi:hypothetical protein